VRGSSGSPAAAAVLAAACVVEAHRPPPGRALEYKAEHAGHVVEVMVVPRVPRAGERAEVIAVLRNAASGQPYRGYVTFLVAPPGGEASPLFIPFEFEPGQFESAHVFREPGVHDLSIVFDVDGAAQRIERIPVTVQPASGVAGGIVLALALVTAATYAAAFRHSRRRGPPGVGHD